MFIIALSKPSVKYLNSMPHAYAEQVLDVLEDLRRDPQSNSVKLLGHLKGLRRAKAGDFRIIFELDLDSNQIFVKAIGPRGDIYK